MYRKDNTEEIRGGILVYISDKIVASEDKTINKLSADFKESLWLILKVGGEDVIFGTVYRKGSSKAYNNTIIRDVITKAFAKYNKLVNIW